MSQSCVQWREPLEFAAGDSLIFNRNLPDYKPVNGWALTYSIRGGITGTVPVNFNGTPDATNSYFEIDVAPEVTKLWLGGEYVLVAEVVNAGLDQRKQIYYGTILVGPDLAGAPQDNIPVQTFAQQQIESLQCALAALNKHALQESNIQQVQLLREKRKDIRIELAYWVEFRRNEVAQENVNNGRPSGNVIKPTFAIINPAPFIGSSPGYPWNVPIT